MKILFLGQNIVSYLCHQSIKMGPSTDDIGACFQNLGKVGALLFVKFFLISLVLYMLTHFG